MMYAPDSNFQTWTLEMYQKFANGDKGEKSQSQYAAQGSGLWAEIYWL